MGPSWAPVASGKAAAAGVLGGDGRGGGGDCGGEGVEHRRLLISWYRERPWVWASVAVGTTEQLEAQVDKQRSGPKRCTYSYCGRLRGRAAD